MSDSDDFMASTDQGIAELAGLCGRYFRSLVAEKFDRSEALQLTIEYQSEIFARAAGEDD